MKGDKKIILVRVKGGFGFQISKNQNPTISKTLHYTQKEFKMQELIQISKTKINGAEINSVNARDLHEVLESRQDFSTWIKNRLNECDAIENIDFIRFHKKMEANNATIIEYIVAIDIAKEIAMLERNDKGKRVRRYFIEVEKRYKENSYLTNQKFTEILSALEQKSTEADIFKSKYYESLEREVVLLRDKISLDDKKSTRLSNDEKMEIIRLYKQGFSQKEIRNRTHRSEFAVRSVIRSAL